MAMIFVCAYYADVGIPKTAFRVFFAIIGVSGYEIYWEHCNLMLQDDITKDFQKVR